MNITKILSAAMLCGVMSGQVFASQNKDLNVVDLMDIRPGAILGITEGVKTLNLKMETTTDRAVEFRGIIAPAAQILVDPLTGEKDTSGIHAQYEGAAKFQLGTGEDNTKGIFKSIGGCIVADEAKKTEILHKPVVAASALATSKHVGVVNVPFIHTDLVTDETTKTTLINPENVDMETDFTNVTVKVTGNDGVVADTSIALADNSMLWLRGNIDDEHNLLSEAFKDEKNNLQTITITGDADNLPTLNASLVCPDGLDSTTEGAPMNVDLKETLTLAGDNSLYQAGEVICNGAVTLDKEVAMPKSDITIAGKLDATGKDVSTGKGKTITIANTIGEALKYKTFELSDDSVMIF